MNINTFLSNPYFVIGAILVLILYAITTRKLKIYPLPVALFVLYFIITLVELPDYVPEKYSYYAKLAGTFILGCAIIRLTVSLIELIFRKFFTISKIMRDALLIFTYIIWAFIVMKIKGDINPVSFLTTSAVLTLVMGLSLQNTLGNLFAGLSLQTERPYKIGDWIKYGDFTGKVVHIGWKSTRILTKEEELIIVPNLNITRTPIENLSKPDNLHIASFEIGVDYDAPPDDVIQTLLNAIDGIDGIQLKPRSKVWLKKFDDFAIIYEVRFSHRVYAAERDLLSEAKRRSWYALKRRGFRIPFPIRDVRPWSEMRAEEKEEKQRLSLRCEEAIKNADIFDLLESSEKVELSKNSKMLEYAPREDIVKEGKAGSSMYIIASGECNVIANGKQVATLTPGAYFGEMSLLTGANRSATVKAATFVETVKIEKNSIAPILKTHEKVSEELAKALTKRQAELNRLKESKEVATSKLLSKIKSFFGI